MFSQIMLGGEVAFAPFSCRGVGTNQQHHDGGGNDDDEWDNESHSPCLVGRQTGLVDEGVEDGRHQEVCDPSSSVAEACSERVARANDVLVEKSSRPYLARHKATAKDTDEETESQETFGTGDCACKRGGYGANQQTGCECVSRPVEIAHRTSKETDKKTKRCQPRATNIVLPVTLRSNETYDIRVGNVDLTELQVFCDGKGQLRVC